MAGFCTREGGGGMLSEIVEFNSDNMGGREGQKAETKKLSKYPRSGQTD